MPKKSFVINPKKKRREREKQRVSRVHAQLARCATSHVLSTIIPAWIIQQSVAPLLPKALITGVLNHIIIILESKLIRKLSWFAHLKSNLLLMDDCNKTSPPFHLLRTIRLYISYWKENCWLNSIQMDFLFVTETDVYGLINNKSSSNV